LLYDAYPLIKAVSRFPIPVITGLGHLKDISLADMVAHTSLKTPTMVAEFIIARNRSFEDLLFSVRQQIVINGQKLLHAAQGQLIATQDEIRNSSRERCASSRDDLAQLKNRLYNNALGLIRQADNIQLDLQRRVSSLPVFQLQRSNTELSNHLRSIQSTAMQVQKSKLTELQAIENIIRILGPESTMKRGYALVLKKGKVVRDIQQISINDTVDIQLIGGQASATINTTQKNG
jgi:exodeoxyribonuclease VII large subunit